MPNEAEVLEAKRNQLLREAERYDNAAKTLRYQADVLLDVKQGNLGVTTNCLAMATQPKRRKAPVEATILEWATNTDAGRLGFKACDCSHYLESVGFQWNNPYGSTYEALDRLLKKGKLVRVGPSGASRFYLPDHAPIEPPTSG